MPTTSLSDLTLALEFISDDSFPDNKAYLSIATGKVLHKSKDSLPTQISPRIPTKRDLGIGVSNALNSWPQTFFRRRGGWSQFKNTLRSHNANKQWHEFENKCIEITLRYWCIENGIEVE